MKESNKFLVQYYLLYFFRNVIFIRQYIVLIMQKSLTPMQIGLIMSIYHIVDLLVEIPASLIANRVGCKKMLLISMLFYFAGYVMIYIDKTVFNFASYFLFFGFYDAVYYTVKDNIIYNNIRYFDLKKVFPKHKLLSKVFGAGILSICAIVAGKVFYVKGENTIILIDLFIVIIYILFIATINEHRDSNEISDDNFLCHFKNGVMYIFKHNTLRRFLIFQAIWSSIHSIFLHYNSVFYNETLSGRISVGTALFLQIIVGALIQMIFVNKLTKQNTYRVCFIFFIAGIASIFFSMIYKGFTAYGFNIIYFLCIRMADALSYTRIHALIPSKFRTVITALVDFCESLLNSALLVIFGYLAKSYCYKVSFLSMAILYSVLSLIFYISTVKDKHLKKIEKRL